MKKRAIIVTAFLCTFCVGTTSLAQGFVKQLARTGMIQQDVDIMVAAGSELYARGGATVGDDTIWLNPETDAHGMAEITEVDGNCVRIAYRFRTVRRPALQTIEARRCLENGRWVLSG